ncbi:MAG: hypothetical protein ACXV4A_12320 [Actinomycetes bacterium]
MKRRLLSLAISLGVLWAAVLPMMQGAEAAPGGTVVVRTVPSLAGVRLTVAGRFVVTGSNGTAVTTVSRFTGISSRVGLSSKRYGRRHVLSLQRVAQLPGSGNGSLTLEVGLRVVSTVRLAVVSRESGVPVSAVQALGLHSLSGRSQTVSPSTRTLRLESRRVQFAHGRLRSQAVTWNVQTVRARPGTVLRSLNSAFDPFSSSTWKVELGPAAGTVDVETVPPTPDVSFAIGTNVFTTDKHGRGSVAVDDLNDVISRLTLTKVDGQVQPVSLVTKAKLAPRRPLERRLVVGLAVSRPVRLTFQTPSGETLDPHRVKRAVLDGGVGRKVTVSGADLADPVWLVAQSAHRTDGGLAIRPVVYRVSEVMVDGSNAVFAGQQQFTAARTEQWTVDVAVFDINVASKDLIFGTGTGGSLRVTRPDGKAFTVRLKEGHSATLPALVRGAYLVKVTPSIASASDNVLVSRSTSVELKVLTLLDVAVVIVAGIGVLLALYTLRRWTAKRVRT